MADPVVSAPSRPHWLQAVLLFLGLVCKGLAEHRLPISCGPMIQCVAGILWQGFAGSFLLLLQPPAIGGRKRE